MNFVKYHESKTPNKLKSFIPDALRIWHKLHPEADLMSVQTIRGVQAIAISLSESPLLKKKEEHTLIQFSAENFIRSSEELKRIEPELEELRFEVFKKKKSPYKDLKQAIRGIKTIAMSELDKCISLSKDISTLPLASTEIYIAKNTPLDFLALKTKHISERTCFTQSSLVSFVLTGIKPIAQVYRVRVEGRLRRPRGSKPIPISPSNLTAFPLSYIDLRLYRALTDRELFSLLKSLNNALKPKQKKSEKRPKLYNFFEMHGQPPAKGKKKYWENALTEWKKQYPDDGINSWRALMMAWRRLNQFLMNN